MEVVKGIVVLDPEKIAASLESAKERVQAALKEKKNVLVICDKSMYTDELVELAKKKGFHYLNDKIPPGFLTNFDTLMSRIKTLNEKALFIDSEDFVRLTKKEQVSYKRDVQKIEKIYG